MPLTALLALAAPLIWVARILGLAKTVVWLWERREKLRELGRWARRKVTAWRGKQKES